MHTAGNVRVVLGMLRRMRGASRTPSPELAVLFLVLAGSGLRLWNLDSLGDFDFDEVAAVWYAREDLPSILANIARAPFEHPPLYYILLHFWIGWFGEAEPVTRAFSIPFGVLLIPATYRLARCYVPAWPAVVAAVVVTVSPLLIFFGREARMYAPAVLFVVLALWLFERAMANGRRRDWAGLSLVVAAGLYLDFSMVIAVVAMAIALPWHWRRHRQHVLMFCAVVIFGAAMVLPWLLIARGLQHSLAAFGTGDIGGDVWGDVASKAWLDLLVGVEGVRGGRLSTVFAAVAAAVVVMGVVVTVARRRGGLMLGYVTAAVVFVGVLLSFDKPYQARYLLPLIPAFGVLTATAFHARPIVPFNTIAGVAVVLIFLVTPVAANRRYYTDYVRGDYRSITTVIEALARPMRPGRDDGKFRDAVVLVGPWQGWFWQHYFPNFLEKVDVWLLPDEVPPSVEADEVDAKLRRAAQNHRRLWVVLAGLEQADPGHLAEAWLSTRLWQARSEVFRNGVLQLYMTDGHDLVSRDGSININDEFVLSSMDFTGYRVDQGPREAADGVRFTIHMSAQQAVDYDLVIRIWVEGPGGVSYRKDLSAHDEVLRRTSKWPLGVTHEIRTALWIPADAPPGDYQAYMSFSDSFGQARWVTGDLAGMAYHTQDVLDIGALMIGPPSIGIGGELHVPRLLGGSRA